MRDSSNLKKIPGPAFQGNPVCQRRWTVRSSYNVMGPLSGKKRMFLEHTVTKLIGLGFSKGLSEELNLKDSC